MPPRPVALTSLLFLACGSSPGTSSCGPEECVSDTDASTGTADTLTSDPTSAATTTADPPTTGFTSSATDATTLGTTTTSTDASTGTKGDGQCHPEFPPPICDGDLVTSDQFEPHEVYLAGTVEEGACYREAIAHWSTPSDAVAGFECYFDGGKARIRPTDGRLLYSLYIESRLREFHCDACPLVGLNFYPNDTLGNDVVLPTPACDPEAMTRIEFLLGAEGQHYYRCSELENTWYDETGDIVFQSRIEHLLHVGRCKQALADGSIRDLESGVISPITGLPPGDPLAIRAAPEGGFWVVKTPDQPELWHVRLDGVATSLGLYPPLLPGHMIKHSALDGCGVLHQITWTADAINFIVQRTLGGVTEIVYSEQTDPFVKIHVSYLTTGP